jgi:hypothetical protein
MIMTFLVSAMLTTLPMEEKPKEVIQFSSEMLIEEQTTIPKPFITTKR